MRCMASVSRSWCRAGLVVLALTHAVHMYYDRSFPTGRSGLDEIVAHHRTMLNQRDGEIRGLVMGGSAAVFGISAERLSQETQIAFYNVALIGQGFTTDNYLAFLESAMSPATRNQIDVAVVAPLRFLADVPGKEVPDRDLMGRSRSLIVPSRSLLWRGYQALTKDGATDLNSQPLRFAVKGPFGDFDLDSYACGGAPPVESVVYPAVDDAAHDAVGLSRAVQRLFPRADLVLVALPEFLTDPGPRQRFLDALSPLMAESRVEFLPLRAHHKSELVCGVRYHASALGREVITQEIARAMSRR